MSQVLNSDDRQHYQRISALCLAVIYGPAFLADLARAPKVLALPIVVLAMLAALYLAIKTWDRLRDAGIWGGFALIILVSFNFGPVLYGSQNSDDIMQFTLTLGNLLTLVPVVLGWIAPSRAEGPYSRAV